MSILYLVSDVIWIYSTTCQPENTRSNSNTSFLRNLLFTSWWYQLPLKYVRQIPKHPSKEKQINIKTPPEVNKCKHPILYPIIHDILFLFLLLLCFPMLTRTTQPSTHVGPPSAHLRFLDAQYLPCDDKIPSNKPVEIQSLKTSKGKQIRGTGICDVPQKNQPYIDK